MSERFKDQINATDPAVRQAARLFRGVKPVAPSADSMALVRRKLRRPIGRARWSRRSLIAVAALAVVMALLAVATAMVVTQTTEVFGFDITSWAIVTERHPSPPKPVKSQPKPTRNKGDASRPRP